MADRGSDYGMWDYGEDWYSRYYYAFFESSQVIPFYAYSDFRVSSTRNFQATVTIQFDVSGVLQAIRPFFSSNYIPVRVSSLEYIGPYWDPWHPTPPSDGGEWWIPEVPVEEIWQAVSGDGTQWNPTQPVEVAWKSATDGKGPWIPIGPDLTPNKEW